MRTRFHVYLTISSIHGKFSFEFRFWAHFFALQNPDTRLKIFPTALKKFALRADHIFHMYCSRMSIFEVLNTKNHSVESSFFAHFESIWLSKKYNIKLLFLGQKVEIQNFKTLYALRKGRNIVRSFVKTAKFLHPLSRGGYLPFS